MSTEHEMKKLPEVLIVRNNMDIKLNICTYVSMYLFWYAFCGILCHL